MPIEWARVRRLARAGFRGGSIGAEDFAYLEQAYDSDPERYRREGEDVRRRERAAMNPRAEETD